MEALGFELFTHELSAAVRSVLLSIAAAGQGFAPFGLAAFPAARTAQAPTSARRCDADREVDGSGRAQSLCPAGPSLCGREPSVRVPAFVRGAGPFPQPSLERVRCPPRKIGEVAGPDNRAAAEMLVGKARRLAWAYGSIPGTANTLCGYR